MPRSPVGSEEIGFVEILHWMEYLKEHYHAEVELHISRNEDDSGNAVLCVTSVGSCKLHRAPIVYHYASEEVARSSLYRLPAVAYELFFILNERLDGGCDECRVSAGLLRL